MTPIEFIKENNLEWQLSFSRSINSTLFGYKRAFFEKYKEFFDAIMGNTKKSLMDAV